jgi:hypothetical protein
MRCTILLIAMVFSMVTSNDQAVAKSFDYKITYDTSSGIYLLDNESLLHMVYDDGSIDSIDRRLSPFDLHRTVLIPPYDDITPIVVRLASRTGVLIGGQYFYSLGRDGHHSMRNLYETGELTCDILEPRDFCRLEAASENSGHYFASYFHRTRGFQFTVWNGTSYGPPSGALANLDAEEDGFDLSSGGTNRRLMPIGTLGHFVLTNEGASQSEPNPLAYLSAGRRQPIEMPWPADFSSAQFLSFRTVGNEVFVLVTARMKSTKKSLAFRLKETSASVKAHDLSQMLGDVAVSLNWLGIDATGHAYAIRDRDSQLISVNLMDGNIKDMITCTKGENPQTRSLYRTITSHNSSAEPGVWSICGNDLIGLRDGGIVTTLTLREGIIRAHLVSTVGHPIDALVAYSDGSLERINSSIRVEVEKLDTPGTTTSSNVSRPIQWEDGQRMCQSSTSLQSGQTKNNVECLDRGSWRATEYPIDAPVDIYETNNYTWAVSSTGDTTRLSRRKRHRSASWEKVADLPAAPKSLIPQFVPTSSADEVGTYVPTQGLFHVTASGTVVRLPIDTSQLATNYRPALSDGWLYAFCKVDGSSPGSEMVAICTFDPIGRRTTLGEFSRNQLVFGDTHGFIPLKRGAMFDVREIKPDSGIFSSQTPWVVFQTKSVKLQTLFGEFRHSSTKQRHLEFLSSPDGSVSILHSELYSFGNGQLNDPLYVRSYRFDGKHLEEIGVISVSAFDSYSPTSKSLSTGSWNRIFQIWTGGDGMWMREGKPGSLGPIPTELSPGALLVNRTDRTNGANFVWTAARNNDEVILANESGLWFCRETDAPKLGASTWRIKRHPSCEHRSFVGKPRQIEVLEDKSILALTGHEIVSYDREHQITRTIAGNVASEHFAPMGDSIWYATATSLRFIGLRSHRDEIVGDLPKGVVGRDVSLATDSYLCTSKGLYRWTGPAPITWTQLLTRCKGAAVTGNSLYVVQSNTLYRCEEATCTVIAALPRPEIDEVVLSAEIPVSGDLLLAQGREIFKLDGSTFRKCDVLWGYGDFPKVSVFGINSGLALTAGGGVIGNVCSEETSVYRLH